MGVEPTYAAWEAAVLPMNYIRNSIVLFSISKTEAFCKIIFFRMRNNQVKSHFLREVLRMMLRKTTI